MKKISVIALGFIIISAISVYAWNLDAKHINALTFDQFPNTRVQHPIRFTLFDQGNTGDEFKCNGNDVWFYIENCPADPNQRCIASINRMASMLLTAKLSGKKVHVHRTGCKITQIALKP